MSKSYDDEGNRLEPEQIVEMTTDIDFIYIWELVNELFDKYEITEVVQALDNDELLLELDELQQRFMLMLNQWGSHKVPQVRS